MEIPKKEGGLGEKKSLVFRLNQLTESDSHQTLYAQIMSQSSSKFTSGSSAVPNLALNKNASFDVSNDHHHRTGANTQHTGMHATLCCQRSNTITNDIMFVV